MSLTASALLALVALIALTGLTSWLITTRALRRILFATAAVLGLLLLAVLIKSLI